MSEDRRCGTCKHLRILPDADGKVRVQKDRSYYCTIEVEWPPPSLPSSVVLAYSFPKQQPIYHMQSSQGAKCPTWELKT